MAKKVIIIDGYIGNYSYSKQFVRNELAGNSKNPVTVQISSLGGQVDHALNIFDQFIEHGNVTAELSAFVASSATLVSLGASHIRMNENSFYLIHKAMNWVDQWGAMNEDEIEEVISNLEKQKQELAKITLQLAKMYVKKTGKSLEAILALMKEETWLTANEAKEWGFVDEVFAPEVATNYMEDLQMVAMITSSGYPAPKKDRTQKPVENSQIDEESFFDRMWSKLTNRQEENAKNHKPKNIVAMKKFEKLNAKLGVESLESVDDSVSLNENQLDSIEMAFSENETALSAAQDAQTTAESERDTAVQNLETTSSAFDSIDQTVADAETPEAKAEAIRTLISAKPGTAPAGNLDTEDPEGGVANEVDQDTIDNLPHNKAADRNA